MLIPGAEIRRVRVVDAAVADRAVAAGTLDAVIERFTLRRDGADVAAGFARRDIPRWEDSRTYQETLRKTAERYDEEQLRWWNALDYATTLGDAVDREALAESRAAQRQLLERIIVQKYGPEETS